MDEERSIVDLNGEFRFKADAKGRMSLPAKFRKVLSDELVVTRDLEDQCLLVFTPEAFNEWVIGLFEDKFGGYKSNDRQHRDLRRKLKARACDVQIDSANRIMLTADQRQAVGIGKDVVIVGNTGYFEVWDAKRYEAVDEQTDLGLLLS